MSNPKIEDWEAFVLKLMLVHSMEAWKRKPGYSASTKPAMDWNPKFEEAFKRCGIEWLSNHDGHEIYKALCRIRGERFDD